MARKDPVRNLLIKRDLCAHIESVIAETGLPMSVNSVGEMMIAQFLELLNSPEDSRAIPPLILMIDQARKAKLTPRKFDSPKLP